MQLTGNVQGLLELLGGGDSVTISTEFESGELLATITLNDDDTYYIYAPTPPTPTEVNVNPILTSGEHIADIEVNGVTSELYAPTVHYSTDEQVIGTWIDGKPLYRKTFHKTTSFNNNGWTHNFLGTEGSGIKIRAYDGYAVMRGTDQLYNYSYWRSPSEFFTAITTAVGDDMSMFLSFSTYYTLEIGYCTILYTKNTD